MTKDEWYDNLLVVNQLTADNLLRVEAPNGDYVNIKALNGMQQGDDPILWLTNASMLTDNDVLVYGSVGAVTDPAKSTGGGVVIIGHGWTSTSDKPAIVITEYPSGSGNSTLWLKYSTGMPSNLSPLAWGNLELKDLTAHGDITISKTNPYLHLNAINTSSPDIKFKENGYTKMSCGYSITYDNFRIYDDVGNKTTLTLNHNGQLALPVNGSSGGIQVGSDMHIYRSDTKRVTIDGMLKIDCNLPESPSLSLPASGGIFWGSGTSLGIVSMGSSKLRTTATVRAGGFESSDGTTGTTADVPTYGGTLHFKNGLFVGVN